MSTNEEDRKKAAEILLANNLPTRFTERHVSARNKQLAEDIAAALSEARSQQREVGRQMLAAELLGHLDRTTSTTAAFHLIKSLCQVELGLEPNSLGVVIEEEAHNNG